MDSIIQDNEIKICFLCGRNGATDHLDCHHVFGGSLRDASEKYGLKVYLCHNRCHIFGEKAVHNNANMMRIVQDEVQRKAMEHYGWTLEEWREKFRRSYLV